MPAQRPSAAFEPIPPDLDLTALIESTPNFEYVTRIPCDMIEHQGPEAFEKLVLLHVVIGGKPLVIDGFHRRLDEWTFTTQWLMDNVGAKFEQARNLTKKENMPLSIKHYLNNLPLLADQWNAYNYKEPNRQRIYLKDIDTPQLWHDKLKEQIPPGVFYLNDSTGDIGGPGSIDEPNLHGLGLRKGKGAAKAGDLMSCLPPAMRAENMMCYIGHEGTYTPAHREMCASLGQNIMVEASGTVERDGKPCKSGSSIWFMTETKDRHLVSEYWLSTLGHDIEVESHFAQINAWKAAPFTTYIVEQKVGDFILIPPLAPHQVWNRGTRTMKAAWNRTTVETLEMALGEAVPRARMVCRDEQYKNKAIVLFALQRYSGLLSQVALQKQTISEQKTLMDLTYSPKIRQLQKDFKRLFALYTQILLSEMPSLSIPPEKRMQYLPYDSFVTCSYCRCNIFNRFLTCPTCIEPLENGEESTYDICLECYVMGRSCRCLSKFKWVEQFPWKDLVEKYDLWRSQIIEFESEVTENSPRSLEDERKRLEKKTLAEICQEQLKARPWRDPKKETSQEVEGIEYESDGFNKDGTLKKKKKKRRSEKWLQDNLSCHICVTRSPKWKHVVCDCGLAFCFGSLWRGFDMMPQAVMENPDWKCPRCLKICPCTSCRKDPKSKPFEPSGTILGHDTKKFADPRSVESLVDFSHSNMHWVKKAGDDHPHENRRLQRRQDEAQQAKSRNPDLNEHYVDDDNQRSVSSRAESLGDLDGPGQGSIPIDPMMLNIDPSLVSRSNSRPHHAAERCSRSTLTLSGGDMRAPAADMAHGSSHVEVSIQRAAVDALKVMDNPYMGAPALGRMAAFQEANGIKYEYPDPDGPMLSPQTVRCVEQELSQEVLQPPDEPCHAGQKRKRASDRPMIWSDFPVAPEVVSKSNNTSTSKKSIAHDRNEPINDPNSETDCQRIVVLHIEGRNLAKLSAKPNGQNTARHNVNHDATNDVNDSKTIISSDFPCTFKSSTGVMPTHEPRKRRRTKEPKDDDFTAGRSKRKLASTDLKQSRAEKLNHAISSDSEVDGEDFEDGNTYNSSYSKPKERSLPAYLARRSPVDTTELPKELSDIPVRRTSQKTQQHPSDSPSADHSPTEHGPANESEASASLKPPNEAKASREVAPSMSAPILPVAESTTNAHINSRRETQNATIAADASAASENSLKAVEKNRKAKLKAVRWAQGNMDDIESDSDSGSSFIELTQPKKQSFRSKFEAAKKIAVQKLGKGPAAAGKDVRRSIFARPGVGKIRITAAKTGFNGAKKG